MSVLHGITTTGFEAQDGFVPYFGVFWTRPSTNFEFASMVSEQDCHKRKHVRTPFRIQNT